MKIALFACLIIWSVGFALMGLKPLFTIGVNDTPWSVLALIALCFAPLPLSLLAFRFERIAGIAMVLCGVYFLTYSALHTWLTHQPFEPIYLLKRPFYAPTFAFGTFLILHARNAPRPKEVHVNG